MSNEIRIAYLEAAQMQQWDEFVQSCPEATFFHRAGWKRVIEQAFGHKTYFLYAEQNNEISAVLPLGHIKSVLFGNALISCPFCVYGGVAAKTESARDALYDAAVELANSLKVDHIELRNRDRRFKDWPGKDLYVTFRKSMDPDPEVNMKAIPRKQRAMVRKGIKAELVSEIDDNVDRFFEIYALSLRNHGTPVFSKKFFRLLKEEFGEACEVSVVTKQARPIASVMSFYFKDEVLPYYGGGTLEARQFKGFDFMYWDVMSRACQKGYRIFDYGRSKQGTGSYSFKKNWGFEPVPLQYEYGLIKADKVPDVNPLNPKYQLFINTWKQLPVALTKLIGPPIAKSLG